MQLDDERWTDTITEQDDAMDQAQEAVRTLLRFIGEDPDRDGLRDTPRRVVKAMREMTWGLGMDPSTVLATSFESGHDQMILVDGIRFVSLCEHHLLPFVGTARVAYIPDNGQILGLSKVARLVGLLAARPQVQERLTDEIAEVLAKTVPNIGVAVKLTASHACAAVRGVNQPGMAMVTTRLRGVFFNNPETRAEFLSR